MAHPLIPSKSEANQPEANQITNKVSGDTENHTVS